MQSIDIFNLLHVDPEAPTGLIQGESDADYRRYNWMGSTALKTYHGSKEGFYKRYIDRDPAWAFGGGKGVRLGSLVDAMIEGTDRQRFADVPEEFMTQRGISTKKDAQAWKLDQEQNGIEIVTPSELKQARMLADRLKSNDLARDLLTGSKQVVARVIHPPTGMPVQVRLDNYRQGDLIVDLKTTSKGVDSYNWGRTCADFGYFIQAGLYREAVSAFDGRRLPFFHVVIQTVYPYEVRCFELNESDVDHGWQQALDALEGIAAMDWGEQQKETDLCCLPDWAK